MRKHVQISGLLSVLLLASGVEAAGLGKLTIHSALGQPLRAEIELVAVQRDELGSISARLATAEAFRQARVERAEILNTLRFEVAQHADGQPVVRITSTAPVNEPYLDMLIELNWSTGRLIREYTLLLDPPAETKPKAEVPVIAPTVDSKPSVNAAAAQAAEPPAQQARPTRYGPVRSGETLRSIASKTKPVDVTLEQMMLAIYQQNRAAFLGDNMNRLKRGAVLNLPDRDRAMLVDPLRASREVRLQAEAWNAYRARLAETAAAQAPGLSPEASAGRVSPMPEQRVVAPAAPVEDVLRLSKGEPGATKAIERIQSLEEELAAKGRALQEAQERVAQLERTVKDLQRLLELKMAEEVARPAAAAAPAAPPLAPQSPPPAPVAQTTAKPAAVPAPLPAPEPEEGPSWLTTLLGNPLYIGGLVAAVLLTFLLWMMVVGNRRRKGLTNFEDSIMTGGEFKNEAVFTAGTGAAGIPTGGSALMTDFSRLGLGAIDAHEVDPIAEAEVYMAYGRDSQAEEILKEALSKDPNRHEIALKLLEIYAARKDTVAFETQASELYASLGGQPTEVWLKAAELGRSIDPDNPLYRVATAEAHPAAVATAVAAAAVGMTVAAAAETAPAVGAPGQTMPLSEVRAPAAEAPAVETAAAPMSVLAAEPLALEPVPAASVQAAEQPSADLEMLEFEPPEQTRAVAAAAVGNEALGGEESALERASPAFADDEVAVEAIEMPLDVVEIEAAEPVTQEITVAEVTSPEGAPPIDSASPESPLASLELDLSGIDLDLGESPPQGGTSSGAGMAQTPSMAGVNEAVAAAATQIDPELWEENNTKLDLARAYLEMGDQEGAREILQEVLNDGDSQQRDEAKKLLSQIA